MFTDGARDLALDLALVAIGPPMLVPWTSGGMLGQLLGPLRRGETMLSAEAPLGEPCHG